MTKTRSIISSIIVKAELFHKSVLSDVNSKLHYTATTFISRKAFVRGNRAEIPTRKLRNAERDFSSRERDKKATRCRIHDRMLMCYSATHFYLKRASKLFYLPN